MNLIEIENKKIDISKSIEDYIEYWTNRRWIISLVNEDLSGTSGNRIRASPGLFTVYELLQ